uniref:CSON012933 protein n=1 Tax=Culicoides sonorensis TaxID=179676 RepID=A0A336MAZ2_CULSO
MHPTTIVHIDIDYFYAQVEEILNPQLKNVPVGIQQKNCLVTCNYKAREYGITKLANLQKAQALCPDLVLVNGEDLTKYKKMSDQIFNVLQTFTQNVEKLGMDENYLDVSELVNARQNENCEEVEAGTFKLDLDGEGKECDCGCSERLKIGTKIAKELRQALFSQLGITSCAGIAHNKLLAKLVGAQNKPNKQTGPVRSLCGIGSKTAEILDSIGVSSVSDLQNIEISVLKKKFDDKTAERLKELSLGIDKSKVKPTGKPKSISIEDSTFQNPLKTILEIETKFNVLLTRLVDAAIFDKKRIPTSLRVTIRKSADIKEILQRESKQKDIPQSWSKMQDSISIVTLLHPIAMQLFKQIMKRDESEFTITLVGVAFTKFIDENPVVKENSLLKFLKPIDTISKVKSPIKTENSPKKPVASKLENFFKRKSESNSDVTPISKESDKSLADDKNQEECVKEPAMKKIKIDHDPSSSSTPSSSPSLNEVESKVQEKSKPLLIPDFTIPSDLDTKTFNGLSKREKKRIMIELQDAHKIVTDEKQNELNVMTESQYRLFKVNGINFKLASFAKLASRKYKRAQAKDDEQDPL